MMLTTEQVLKFFVPMGGKIYVLEEFFELMCYPVKNLKIRRAEYNGKKKKDTYEFKKHYRENGTFSFAYEYLSVPKPTREKYEFPDLMWIASHFSKTFQLACIPEEISTNDIEIKLDLLKGMKDGEDYVGYFYNRDIHYLTSLNLAMHLGVLERAIKYINSLENNYGLRKRLFKILSADEFKHLFFSKDVKSFYRQLLRAKDHLAEGGLEELIDFVQGKYGKTSNAKKISDIVLSLLITLKGHINNPSNKLVKIWLNTCLLCFPKLNGRKIFGQTRVDDFINGNKKKIRYYQNQEEELRRHILPYLKMIQAENPYDQFQFDEWYVEVSAKDRSDVVELIMLTMKDSCSRKTIHRKYLRSVKKEDLKLFLHETIQKYGNKLAAEFLCDHSSVNASEMIRDVFAYFLTKYPGKFKFTITSESNRKAITERYYRTIASSLMPYVGWKGFGYSARADCPAKVLKLVLNNPAYLDDTDGVIAMLENFHDQINRNGIHLDADSPNELFESLPRPNKIQLTDDDVAYAFYDRRSVKLNQNTVTVNERQYSFGGASTAFINGDDVTCCYSEKDEKDSVYVYQLDTTKFLGKFQHKGDGIHSAWINQTSKDGDEMSEKMKERNGIVKALKTDKTNAIAALTSVMHVNPGKFVINVFNSQLPRATNSASVVGVKSKVKKQIDPFNVSYKDYREHEKGGKNKTAKPPKYNSQDNFKTKMYDQ